MARPIIERERELAQLRSAVREAAGGVGSVVLIAGEAGIGKSTLIDALPTVLPPPGRLLVGNCDDLTTPRVLGPLRDLVGLVGPALAGALESVDRAGVLDALRTELAEGNRPTVLVVEDVHWADEATLDVLRFLVRRVATLPAVLALTYRDEDLTREHPLHGLLGLISRTARVRRLPLAPLSAPAVRHLGAHTGLDPDRVYAITSGNPFFVVEVLAGGDLDGVPTTVAEAVQARLSGLDATTRDALETLAVIPSAVERWLVELVVADGLAALASAERHGVLVVGRDRVAFRHELMRRTIVDAMPAGRRLACNRAVLGALLAPPSDVDISRIVHHAAEAGDVDTVLRFGRLAAKEAVAAGSHTEAVAHYGRLVEQRGAFAPAERAELLETYAVECYTTGRADLAVAAQRDAVRLWRDLDAARPLGLALRWLSRMCWWAGNRPAAEAAGAEAAAVLADADDPGALAMALSNESQLSMLSGRWGEAVATGERAAAMAREANDAATLAHALTNVGASRWYDDPQRGEALLAEALAVALAANQIEHACRANVAMAWQLIEDWRLVDADRVLAAAVALAEEHEFLAFLGYLRVEQSMITLARGEWERAEREAEWALDVQPTTRCPALTVRGRARARRGADGHRELLAEAWELAERLDEVQRVGPAGAALLEAAWLDGDPSEAVAAVLPWLDRVRARGTTGCRAQFGFWLRRAGAPVPPEEGRHPYALLAAGNWREAAEIWQRAGCRYEQALALADSDDPADVLAALGTLDGLGAEPLARRVRARLRGMGVTQIPRGPARSTRDNPAGLTGRQMEVVRLLAGGLTNAEMAARLVLSVRTVDAHVAAVLDKLAVSTRRDAVARARELNLLDESRAGALVDGTGDD